MTLGPSESEKSAIDEDRRKSCLSDNLSFEDITDDSDSKCGWNKCKPDTLQRLNTPKWFLFFLVCFSAAQGEFLYSKFIYGWNIALCISFCSTVYIFVLY